MLDLNLARLIPAGYEDPRFKIPLSDQRTVPDEPLHRNINKIMGQNGYQHTDQQQEQAGQHDEFQAVFV